MAYLAGNRAMLLEELKQLECSLHGARRNDREWLEQTLHQEFREITRSGVVVDRAQTIASLTGEEQTLTILSSDFRLVSNSDHFAILHYRTFRPDGTRVSLRSSCWICSDDGKWTLIFHQGTPEAGSA